MCAALAASNANTAFSWEYFIEPAVVDDCKSKTKKGRSKSNSSSSSKNSKSKSASRTGGGKKNNIVTPAPIANRVYKITTTTIAPAAAAASPAAAAAAGETVINDSFHTTDLDSERASAAATSSSSSTTLSSSDDINTNGVHCRDDDTNVDVAAPTDACVLNENSSTVFVSFKRRKIKFII